MNQLKTVVDSNSLGDFPDSFFNRSGVHCLSKKVRRSTIAQRKSGHSPPDQTAVLRASGELYVKDPAEAT
jgi:hypothetical protein